jgi:hypothetical protein
VGSIPVRVKNILLLRAAVMFFYVVQRMTAPEVYFSKIYYHTLLYDSVSSGDSVAPTLQDLSSSMLVSPSVV